MKQNIKFQLPVENPVDNKVEITVYRTVHKSRTITLYPPSDIDPDHMEEWLLEQEVNWKGRLQDQLANSNIGDFCDPEADTYSYQLERKSWVKNYYNGDL